MLNYNTSKYPYDRIHTTARETDMDLSKMSDAALRLRWNSVTWSQGDNDPIQDEMQRIGDELSRRLSDARGRYVHCCVCGRCVDTREEGDGGDSHGSQLATGEWVCSPECDGVCID